MLKKIKMFDIFGDEMFDEISDGLFYYIDSHLRSFLNLTYGIEDYNSSTLHNYISEYDGDMTNDYFLEHSSEKYISRFGQRLIKMYTIGGVINYHSLLSSIAFTCVTKFGTKWWKIWNALDTNYRPLENYDMEEIRTPNLTENLTRKQNTDTNVHQETESGIYGFNSTESNPTATGEGDTHTTGLKANNEIADTKTNTGTESLTRHGNIGVTTSQQMLESEIKLRQYNFIEEVFKDIDSILCLKIY